MKNSPNHIEKSPIGIFDSGIGGLSICKEIINRLPNESIIYLADSLNAPYGEKTKAEIIALSIKNTELLIKLGCKIIVVACNTATTNAISILRERYLVSFIGIEPAIKPAALQTKTGIIGILATEGTLKSDLFISNSEQFRKSLEIIEVKGENLVRMIESGDLESTKPLLEGYLLPMIKQGVDNIVLGCTHYPFLIPIIQKIVPSNIVLIDSGEAVARQTELVLTEEGLLNKTASKLKLDFYTNENVVIIRIFLKKLELVYSNLVVKDF